MTREGVKIGEEVYIHGYIDKIRKDIVIIRNEGGYFGTVSSEINTLEQESNKWIPVSERLPKENGWYQCTVIPNNVPMTLELFFKNGKWLDNRRINMFDLYDIYGYGNTKEKHKLSYQDLISEFEWTENVIAWMPLPEPYRGETK